MRVLACGSRTFHNRALLGHTLDYLRDHTDPLIAGGARGADTMAVDWANMRGIPVQEYPADWDRYGKRAGWLRNVQMLKEGKPDLVIAFVDKPLYESKGTAMMVDLARSAGVETWVLEVQ